MPKAAAKTASPRRTTRAKAPASEPTTPTLQQAGGAAVRSLARQLHSWTGTLLGGVGTVAIALLWMKLFPSLRKVERLE